MHHRSHLFTGNRKSTHLKTQGKKMFTDRPLVKGEGSVSPKRRRSLAPLMLNM